MTLHLYNIILNHQGLTLIVGKSTERSSRTVASLLDVVALGGFVDFRVELLLGPCMTVRAGVALIAVGGVSPFVV
jgi:hypothetical protein